MVGSVPQYGKRSDENQKRLKGSSQYSIFLVRIVLNFLEIFNFMCRCFSLFSVWM